MDILELKALLRSSGLAYSFEHDLVKAGIPGPVCGLSCAACVIRYHDI